MHIARLVSIPLLGAALCAGLPSASAAQGGWRQWDVHLRDGRRLVASPLGAPDDGHLSLSVAGFETREDRVARARVRVVAAQSAPGDSLPALRARASCTDAIVRRDGTRIVGRITLARVRWSEGIVVQRGDTIDLEDVAYLVFASPRAGGRACRGSRT
jgi:hypothetical protein